ncbi:MAG: ribonuclease P protein component [Oscillospiraceae bacterium]|jgi:ribonuclease P protein component|nr:ribonuclease P protein component [Oscillospiraceae bacterium]
MHKKFMQTLTRNGDFRRAYGRGKSLAQPALVVYATKNRAGRCRYGITTSKKLGNAVERNRCRRVIREALRTLDEPFAGNWDLVFVARAKTKFIKSNRLREVMRRQLRQLGVVRAPE